MRRHWCGRRRATRRKSATRAWPGCGGTGSHAPVAGLKHCGPSGEYQETCAADDRAALRHGAADGEPQRLHAGDGLAHAGRIPHFKGAELPVEAGAHGCVDGGSVVGDFADAVGGVVPERGEKWPEKGAALSFAGSLASSRRRRSSTVAAFFAISSEGSAGFGGGAVLERVEIEDEALVFSICAAGFSCRSPGRILSPSQPRLTSLVENLERICRA